VALAEQHDRLLVGQPALDVGQRHGGVAPVGLAFLRVQLHAAVLAGHGQAGLGAEERLVLHADLVVALHGDLSLGPGVAEADLEVPEQVAVGVDGRGRQGRLGVDQGLGDLVVDGDGGRGPAGGLRVVGGDRGHRLAVGADHQVGEDRLVVVLEAVGAAAPEVVVGDDGMDAGDGEGGGGVEGPDAGRGVGAAQGRAPEHPLQEQVRGEGELPGGLGRGVGPQDALAQAGGAALAREGARQARGWHGRAPP
jgi:hypothetical protein